MKTLNNQLVEMNAQEGDEVICGNWLGVVYMNEFGLGVYMKTSHEPGPICDGFFPAMTGLRFWNSPKMTTEDGK